MRAVIASPPNQPSRDAGAASFRLATVAALAILDFYTAVVSPILTGLLGHACRFHPSCSVYARQTVASHGLARGSYFAIRRLCRCRPGGGWGEDPVPHRDEAAARP